MESDPILSRDEIAALLAAIRDPAEARPLPEAPADAPIDTTPLRPLDFRRLRRFRATDLARLGETLRPLLDAAARSFGTWLGAPAQARLLAPAESTPAELLEGHAPGNVLARAGDLLVDPSPAVAFALVERSLGGGRLTKPPDRPLRDLETELVAPALAELIAGLSSAWSPGPAAPLRWERADALAREPWPEGSYVGIGVEFLAEGLLGDVLVAVPASRLSALATRAPAAAPAETAATVRFPAGTLTLGDLRKLAPGDLLIFGGDPAPEVTIDVAGVPKFAGRPGTLGGRIAVEIRRPAGPSPADAPIVRESGGDRSPGAPDVPVALRAVLAERSIELKDLAALRPGAIVAFSRRADAPVDLYLGSRPVARGAAVLKGDRIAVQIGRDSAARNL